MPKSKWQAGHVKCQAAVDAVRTDLAAEIERLQRTRDYLWGTLRNAYDDLESWDADDLRRARRLILPDIQRALDWTPDRPPDQKSE